RRRAYRRAEGLRAAPAHRGRRLVADRDRTPRDGLRIAAAEPARGAGGDGALRAGGGDPRRARLRLLPAQQAGGVGRLPPPRHALRAGHVPAGVVTALVDGLMVPCGGREAGFARLVAPCGGNRVAAGGTGCHPRPAWWSSRTSTSGNSPGSPARCSTRT